MLKNSAWSMAIFSITKKIAKRTYILRMKITLHFPQLPEYQGKRKMGLAHSLIQALATEF